MDLKNSSLGIPSCLSQFLSSCHIFLSLVLIIFFSPQKKVLILNVKAEIHTGKIHPYIKIKLNFPRITSDILSDIYNEKDTSRRNKHCSSRFFGHLWKAAFSIQVAWSLQHIASVIFDMLSTDSCGDIFLIMSQRNSWNPNCLFYFI